MTDETIRHSESSDERAADLIDRVCDDFERAWVDGENPRVEDYVREIPGSPRAALLMELIALDLEYRLKAGEHARIEEYFQRFSELEQDKATLRELVDLEYELRFASEPDLTPNEFRRRFPTLPTPKPPGKGIHTRCPHCHNPIELVDDSSLRELACPSCGSSINLLGVESTATFAGGVHSVAHFKLLDRVGIGHFGEVWKARDTQLDRIVALKVPRKDQLDSEETEKFFREARAAAQLKHPHIVSVFEVGRAGETIFIASEFVTGANLREWLTGQRLTLRESSELCLKIAQALQHAHEAGVIHRDLKPSNIMIDMQGEPHIMDFGLAKREAGEITMTMDGQILGTPAYMPPEQAAGKGHEADARSDIYSLGIILYELMTGELPFRGDTRMIIVQILQEEPPMPRALNNRIPRDLETICLKCMEKEPSHRYASAKDVIADIEKFLKGERISARPTGFLARTLLWARRIRRVHDAGIMMICFGIGTAAVELLAFGSTLLALISGNDDIFLLPFPRAEQMNIAFWMFTFLIAGLFLAWIGRQTVQHRSWAIWTGLVLMVPIQVFVTSILLRLVTFDAGGLLSDPGTRSLVFLPIFVWCTAVTLMYAVAVFAAYSNAGLIRWRHPNDSIG